VLRRRRDDEAQQLAAASDLDHWTRLERQRRRRLQASRLRVAFWDRVAQLRQDGALFASLTRRIVAALAGAVALVVALEAIASSLTHTLHWGTLFEPVSADSYGGFVGAVVGAQATFLALFFTTVGVIASTTYSRVPGEIRSLFVRERTSLIYVWNVAVALLVGIALLIMPVVTHHSPHGLTVAVFAVLTTFSVLSLVLLGTQLFNFFDLSTLSQSLPRRFRHGLQAASAADKAVPEEAQQQAAHERAATVLRIYGQLSDLIASRDVAEAEAPERIALELLGCWAVASALKPTIPTESKWYSLTAAHPNWLTMDHTQLSMALATNAGVQPTLSPDPLWVESAIAQSLGRLLPTLATPAEWPRAIQVADEANKLVFYLAARLQLDEARLLLRTVGVLLKDLSSGDLTTPGADRPTTSGEWEVSRMAAAERATLGHTQYWLGLIRPFEQIDPQRLGSSFDEAVATPQGPYKAGAPRSLLDLFEDIASGIAFEQRTEHQQVTPDWWVHHLAARTLLHTLIEAIRTFFEEVQAAVVGPLITDSESSAELITVGIFDALELAHKLGFHLRTAHRAVAALDSMRHDPSNDELWPDGSLPDDVPPRLEEQLYRKLAEVAPRLRSNPHDSTRPDLFGQGYKRLSDATFHAILQAQTDLARQLFPSFVTMADRARVRLVHDLTGHRVRDQAIFGTEPLVDMMELSGLALLMSEVDPATGIWPDVHALWDQILSSATGPALAAQLTAVLSVHANLFAITSGGIGRTDRQMALARLLTERGLGRRDRIWGEPAAPEPESPIVAVFAPWDLGDIHENLADLFIVEYLARRPNLLDLQIPRRAEMLRESLDHQRQRRDHNGSLDDEDDEES
jgi:hypothetical protein